MIPPSVKPLGAERHRGRYWRPMQSLAWASQQVVVPMVGTEIAAAALHLPTGFMKLHDQLLLCAVTGLEPGSNVFVGADGRWQAGYIPAVLRMRPFAILPTSDQRRVLCVDEAAAEVSEVQQPGMLPFFGEGDELSPQVRDVFQFLSQVENAKPATAAACAALEKHGVLVPLTVQFRTPQGQRQAEGLLRVDEEKLLKLPDEAFLEVRRAGALQLAYGHLLSLQHYEALVRRAEEAAILRQQAATPVTAGGDLDLSFLSGGDTLKFS